MSTTATRAMSRVRGALIRAGRSGLTRGGRATTSVAPTTTMRSTSATAIASSEAPVSPAVSSASETEVPIQLRPAEMAVLRRTNANSPRLRVRTVATAERSNTPSERGRSNAAAREAGIRSNENTTGKNGMAATSARRAPGLRRTRSTRAVTSPAIVARGQSSTSTTIATSSTSMVRRSRGIARSAASRDRASRSPSRTPATEMMPKRRMNAATSVMMTPTDAAQATAAMAVCASSLPAMLPKTSSTTIISSGAPTTAIVATARLRPIRCGRPTERSRSERMERKPLMISQSGSRTTRTPVANV